MFYQSTPRMIVQRALEGEVKSKLRCVDNVLELASEAYSWAPRECVGARGASADAERFMEGLAWDVQSWVEAVRARDLVSMVA